jgi:hypothetical protein
MTLLAPRTAMNRPRHVRLGPLTLATSGLLVVGMLGVSPGAGAQTVHQTRLGVRSELHAKHKKKKTHEPKAQESSSRACLEGNWAVTTLTLSTTGLTFTGGTGTTVDITSNGNAVGNFTPGTPLTGTEGSAKFNGTITDHYGFSPTTTARSGTFPVTPVSNDATITVAGVTKPVTSVSEQGSYVCTGKDLSLTFASGASTLMYQLAPAS